MTCSDFSNVTELSRGQSAPGTNTIIHNTYFLNNYAVNSYYTYGVSIFDVTRKNNLVEVGNFDTSPGFSGDGFNGAWGVWCYLPSGNIIASDIETGLWVLKPTYKRACYLEGTVVDTLCGTLLNNVYHSNSRRQCYNQIKLCGQVCHRNSRQWNLHYSFLKTGLSNQRNQCSTIKKWHTHYL
jgi:hypothetical protein